MKSREQHVLGFAYAVGEEVVARLDGVEVHTLEHGAILPPGFCPGWTIATVMEYVTLEDGRRSYAVRFALDDETHVAVVPEEAIDGTA